MPTKKVTVITPDDMGPEILQNDIPAAAGVNADVFAALVQALTLAIQSTKPIEKKNALNRKSGTPWDPKNGVKKLKLKRKIYQHGLEVDPDRETNETIELMNQLRPGSYFDGWVKVVRRRDKGLDIDYPVRNPAQRMKLSSQYGVTSFTNFLTKMIDQAANPAKYADPDDN